MSWAAARTFSITALGQRDVAEFLGHLLAIGQAVLDHLLDRRDLGRVLAMLVEQHPGEGGDRIGLGAGRVGDEGAHVVVELGASERIGAALAARGDVCAGGVLQDRHRRAGQLGVAVLDVADRAGGLHDGRGDAVVLRGLDDLVGGRPLHRGAGARARLEVGVDRGEVAGEVEGRARSCRSGRRR